VPGRGQDLSNRRAILCPSRQRRSGRADRGSGSSFAGARRAARPGDGDVAGLVAPGRACAVRHPPGARRGPGSTGGMRRPAAFSGSARAVDPAAGIGRRVARAAGAHLPPPSARWRPPGAGQRRLSAAARPGLELGRDRARRQTLDRHELRRQRTFGRARAHLSPPEPGAAPAGGDHPGDARAARAHGDRLDRPAGGPGAGRGGAGPPDGRAGDAHHLRRHDGPDRRPAAGRPAGIGAAPAGRMGGGAADLAACGGGPGDGGAGDAANGEAADDDWRMARGRRHAPGAGASGSRQDSFHCGPGGEPAAGSGRRPAAASGSGRTGARVAGAGEGGGGGVLVTDSLIRGREGETNEEDPL